jgi:hypothetical protein
MIINEVAITLVLLLSPVLGFKFFLIFVFPLSCILLLLVAGCARLVEALGRNIGYMHDEYRQYVNMKEHGMMGSETTFCRMLNDLAWWNIIQPGGEVAGQSLKHPMAKGVYLVGSCMQ